MTNKNYRIPAADMVPTLLGGELKVVVSTDNDGTDDHSRETLFSSIGKIEQLGKAPASNKMGRAVFRAPFVLPQSGSPAFPLR